MRIHSLLILSFAYVSEALGCGFNNSADVDVIFVLDGSGSIGRERFHAMKHWIANATSFMHSIFGRRAQFGLLQYSNNDDTVSISKSHVFDVAFRLGDCLSSRCTRSRVLAMRYLGGSTYTSYALRRVLEVEFPLSSRFPIAQKVLILLTDAKADDADSLNTMYKKAKDMNVQIFGITVGDFDEMKLKLATSPGMIAERIFTKLSRQTLNSITDSIMNELYNSTFLCDECKSDLNNCSPDAECMDLEVGYECRCKLGFRGNGIECRAINHCQSSPPPCASVLNSICESNQNGPACVCPQGYQYVFDDNSCIDIDDCQSNPCEGTHQICQDLLEGYKCLCEEGFWWNGVKCTDAPKENADVLMIVFLVLALTAGLAVVLIALYTGRRRRTYIIARPEPE